ncbi:MAG: thiosulfate dehydrogenase (quinone) large subunit [Actinomycetota bacterium]|nr:thiosulfate dehydrogenase (quinone) large subunit [Actinomycetota bacterium]
MPWSARLLRAFLGVTFVFAGVQKFLDGNFLHQGSPDYIGAQLTGFSHGTPVSFMMGWLAKAPVLVGVCIALAEIAIGIATLVGVAMLAAAAAGFAINVVLFLSATWHVHPFFLGSDSIYAVAWLALGVAVWEMRGSLAPRRGVTAPLKDVGRREFVRGGLVAGSALVVGIASKALAGPPITGGNGISAASHAAGTRGSSQESAGPSSPSSAISTARPAPKGQVIATLSKLPVGRAVGFTGPGGIPAVVLRLANDHVVAYSRVCTHAGCAVGYDQSARILICPCHGAEFDPAHNAQPIAGPTSTPLQSIRVVVDAPSGKVILPQ